MAKKQGGSRLLALVQALALAAIGTILPAATTTAARPDLADRLAAVQADTERLFGASYGSPMATRFLTREELGATLQELLKEELEKPEVKGLLRLYECLGMVPSNNRPWVEVYQGLLEGQVGGLYVPKTKQLYVVSTFDPMDFVGGVILSHEMCHALQDKVMDLHEYLEKQTNQDVQRARQAVAEGDATVLMMYWGAEKLDSSAWGSIVKALGAGTEGLDRTPSVLVQDMIFPYLAGAEFIEAVRRKRPDGWRDWLLQVPPQSSEQILHPAKYTEGTPENPVEVKVGKPRPGAPLQEVYRNTMGEWTTRLFLTPPRLYPKLNLLATKPLVTERIASEAAAGWGGDTIVLLEDPSNPSTWAIAWISAWDTAEDAAQFDAALVRRMRLRLLPPPKQGEPLPVPAVNAAGWKIFRGEKAQAGWYRRGRTVTVLLGSSQSALTEARKLVP